jgi:hypothetical protein
MNNEFNLNDMDFTNKKVDRTYVFLIYFKEYGDLFCSEIFPLDYVPEKKAWINYEYKVAVTIDGKWLNDNHSNIYKVYYRTMPDLKHLEMDRQFIQHLSQFLFRHNKLERN